MFSLTFRRIFELIAGTGLIVLGLILFPLPGPFTTPLVIAGVLLISPYHGRRMAWWVVVAFKWSKQKWHEYRHNRRAAPRSRHGKKKRKLWPFDEL